MPISPVGAADPLYDKLQLAQCGGRARDPASDPSGLVTAMTALALGDHMPLLHLLETPAGRRAWWFAFYSLGCSPLLDPLASEPAYRALLAQQHVQRCTGTSAWPIKAPPR